MLGSTFLLAQAHAPDAPQQENSYGDSSVALANSTPVPTCAQPSSGDMAIATHLPETSTSERVSSKQQAELDEVATEVNFSHAQSSRIYKQGMVHKPLRHSCDLGVVREEVPQALCLLLGIGQVQAPDAPHQADATAKLLSAPAGLPCAPTCHACGSVAKAMPVQEAARLVQRTRDSSGLALQCKDRLKHGVPFTCKDGNPLSPHVSGWHRDYFLYFEPWEKSKRKHSQKNVQEMQALLEKETEMLLNALRDSEEPTSCIYELKCCRNTKDKYLCVVPDRACLGLQRTDIERTKFQDRKHVSEGFWSMFAAIEWEDHRVGSKRKKTT